MKKILTITFAICLMPFAFAQQYGWVDLSKNLPDLPYDTIQLSTGDTMISQLTDVFFIDDNEGWVSSSQAEEIADSAVIFHTTDGGESWEIQYIHSQITQIWMLNSQIGYAGSHAGRIYVTHNGGQNWDYHGYTGNSVTDMYFPPDSDTGFVCCDDGYKYFIIKPEEVEAHNVPYPNFWSGISVTSDGVWLIGGASVYCIKDGNITFHSAPICGYWTSMYFINDEYGWLGNDCAIEGFVGPEYWATVCDPYMSFTCIHAIDKDHVWATLFDGRIMHTTNGSEYGFDTITHYEWSDVVWETQSHPHPNARKRAIFFTSANNGYAVANENVILKYTEVFAIGERQFEELVFEVFPNPCRDEINLRYQIPDTRKTRSEIIDITGCVVKSLELKGQKNTIDVSFLPAGVYFIKLQTGDKVGVRKIIIQ